MTEYHSSKIQNIIQKELFKATKSIRIAVAWFTNDLLFQPLLMKLQMGVSVELIINKDEVNCGDANDVDFNEFESQGGVLHWNDTKTLLHDKFCMIDDNVIISGSYNWTNKAEYNEESIAVTRDDASALSFWSNKFAQLAAKYPASENSVAKRREMERKQEEERIRKEAELRRKQEEERRMLAYQQQQRIAAEKKRREEEAERVRKAAEEAKRKEQLDLELEKTEICLLERPYTIWGNPFSFNSMIEGKRVLFSLSTLLLSCNRNILYGINELVFYDEAKAYNPNIKETERTYKRVLKFKTKDGKYRLFLAREDFAMEEVINYMSVRKKDEEFVCNHYKCFDNVENKFLSINPNDIIRYNMDESQQPSSIYSSCFNRTFILPDYKVYVSPDEERIENVLFYNLDGVPKERKSYIKVYRSAGELNVWAHKQVSKNITNDEFVNRLLNKFKGKSVLRINWKKLFPMYKQQILYKTHRKEKFDAMNKTASELAYSWRMSEITIENLKKQLKNPCQNLPNWGVDIINMKISDNDIARAKQYIDRIRNEYNNLPREEKLDFQIVYSNDLKTIVDYCIPELELREL